MNANVLTSLHRGSSLGKALGRTPGGVAVMALL